MSNIAVIGLGYVGLPLAVEFGKLQKTIAFDIDEQRVKELKKSYDRTLEVDTNDLKNSKNLYFTASENDLESAAIYIITVPTPVDEFKKPNLRPLVMASSMVGKYLNAGDIVIYESTVYPGVTEEVCVPELERESDLKFNVDFYCGYSPERINPGDKINTLTNIKKVTSGSTPETAKKVDALYNRIIKAGTHLAPSIKVAEAAKVIENSQRDINIAFVNELALIFDKIGIDTTDVLEAAGTKWNFLNFRQGLVGGHCIGVDPFYLTQKAESLGYHPEVILAGRRINDNMGIFVANQCVKLLVKHGHSVRDSKALLLGFSFKEDCPDIRNTRVIDIYEELKGFGIEVCVFDPFVNKEEALNEYNIEILKDPGSSYDLIILAVAHKQFLELKIENLKRNSSSVVFDVKSFLPRHLVTSRL